MLGQMVSMKDYEDIGGFGIAKGGVDEVDDLNKALSAGFDNPPTVGGGALRVESLEATLRVVTFSQKNVRGWRGSPKLPAYNTVEEYNILSAYGSEGGAFTDEGDLPETQDSSYERKTALIKFMGTVGEITHPMMMVRPAHGNVQALETQNKATYLLEQLERAFFGARSDVIAQEPDGIYKQILDGNGITDPNTQDPTGPGTVTIVDLRGGNLTEDIIEDASNLVAENYGAPTDLYSFPRQFSSLAKSQFDRKRYNVPPAAALGPEGRIGFSVTEQMTGAGLVQFQPDVFIRPGRRDGVKTAPSAATSTKAPGAPTIAIGAPGVDAASKFTAGTAGTFVWIATALNRFGESAASAGTAATAIAAGESVLLTVTDGGGANPATGYRIYRTDDGVTDVTLAKLVTTVKATAGAGSGCTYTDRDWWVPGTGMSCLIQRNLQNISVRQLAPMLKIPLATVAASIRWMQLLYWCLIIYSPKKNVLFINVGEA